MKQDEKDVKLEIVEFLLTAELYNTHTVLDASDLPPAVRRHFWDAKEKGVPRPITVRIRDIEQLCGVRRTAAT